MSRNLLAFNANILLIGFITFFTVSCVSIPEKSFSLAESNAKREDVAIIRGHNLIQVSMEKIPRDVGTIVLKPGIYKVRYGNDRYKYSVILNAKPGRTYLLTNEREKNHKSRFEFIDVTDDPKSHITEIPK